MTGARFQDIEVTVKDGISAILLNRPASLNACTSGMLAELQTALVEAACDEDVRAVVLGGKGRLFCAGADLAEESRQGALRVLMDSYWPVFHSIISMDKPVIAAVNGGAAGVGMSLALACDLVLMAEDAWLLSPFNRIGLVPDGGATWLLVRQMGHARAFEFAAGGDRLPALRAREMGLANRLVAADELLHAAIDWARQLAGNSALALAQTKKLMRLAATCDFEAAFRAEALAQEACGNSAFHLQARRDFFAKTNAKSSAK